MRRGGLIALALLVPGLAYLALFFLVPFVSLLITSFGINDTATYGGYYYAFYWQNYVDVIAAYWPQFLRSFWYALLATVFALLISYPIAYFIGVTIRERKLLRNLLLVLVIAPFFISFLLRTLAWKQILSDEGPVVGSAAGRRPHGAAGPHHGHAVRGGVRAHLQLHPLHDAPAVRVARPPRQAADRGRQRSVRQQRRHVLEGDLPAVAAGGDLRARC